MGRFGPHTQTARRPASRTEGATRRVSQLLSCSTSYPVLIDDPFRIMILRDDAPRRLVLRKVWCSAFGLESLDAAGNFAAIGKSSVGKLRPEEDRLLFLFPFVGRDDQRHLECPAPRLSVLVALYFERRAQCRFQFVGQARELCVIPSGSAVLNVYVGHGVACSVGLLFTS